MYLNGIGVEKDRAKAEELCRQAANIRRKDRGTVFHSMYPDRRELRELIGKLEKEWEDEELRERLRKLRLWLSGDRKE